MSPVAPLALAGWWCPRSSRVAAGDVSGCALRSDFSCRTGVDGQLGLAVDLLQGQFPGTLMALRHGSVGMLPPYCQLFIQAIMIRLFVRHVVERDAGVEVAAVVQPMGPLGRRQGRCVGEGELVGQDVAPAAGVVVDDLDPGRSALPGRGDPSPPSRGASLLGPVAVRTTWPSTTRLTVVSTDDGSAAGRRRTRCGRQVMCPQPPVLPGRRSDSGHCFLALGRHDVPAIQLRMLVCPEPVAVLTTWPSTTRLTAVASVPVRVYGWLPPPTRKFDVVVGRC